jgi:surface antigen
MLSRVLLLSTALLTSACASNGSTTPQGVGAGVGAVSGGLIGSQFGKGNGRIATTALGAAAGGIIGYGVGQWLNDRDRRIAEDTHYRALETGQSNQRLYWRSPDSNAYGEVMPSRPYRIGTEDCRDYTHTIYVDQRPQTMRGTACRNPDGTWRKIG